MTEAAPAEPKQLEWIGSSKKDLKALPEEVIDVFVCPLPGADRPEA